jgi:hypothetical protein
MLLLHRHGKTCVKIRVVTVIVQRKSEFVCRPRLAERQAAHTLVSVILPTSTKFHSMERFCELYAGSPEKKKQMMNDVPFRAGNESV